MAQLLAGHRDSLPLRVRGADLARALAWSVPAQLQQALGTADARQPLPCASVHAWQCQRAAFNG